MDVKCCGPTLTFRTQRNKSILNLENNIGLMVNRSDFTPISAVKPLYTVLKTMFTPSPIYVTKLTLIVPAASLKN